MDTVPELASDPVLKNFVATINDEQTGAFSIGCASTDIVDRGEINHTGYVEFAVNSRTAVGDAQTYFGLWYHIKTELHRSGFKGQVHLIWEIQPAFFHDAGGVYGFSCSIFFQTATTPDKGNAQRTTPCCSIP